MTSTTRSERSISTAGSPSEANLFRVGRAFQDKHVALRPTTADGVWDVFFSLQPVRNIDLATSDVE